ncbi:MAG: hypothetical protein Q9162_000240 [Coniocarpon cinnabarinum]
MSQSSHSGQQLSKAAVRQQMKGFPTQQIAAGKLRSFLEEGYKDHAWVVAKTLRATKERINQQKRPDPHAGQDPFASLSTDKSPSNIEFECIIQPSSGTNAINRGITVTPFEASAARVPEFTHYTASNSSILGRNETEIRFYPDLADEDARQLLERDLRKHFDERNPATRAKHVAGVTKLRQLKPYFERFLTEMDVNWQIVLQFILDKDVEFKEGMPHTLKKIFSDRASYCSKKSTPGQMDFASSSDDQPSLRQLASAGLCCKVIKDVCKIRVWPAIEELVFEEAQAHGDAVEDATLTRSAFKVHQDFQCAICLLHNCTQHGEHQQLSDDADADADADANADADAKSAASEYGSQEPWDRECNHRTRILEDATTVSRKRKVSTSTFMELINGSNGQQDDGSIEVTHNLSDMSSAMPDERLCSESCFWKISERQTSNADDWTQEEINLLSTYLPSFASDKRGPCVLQNVFKDKTCAQVFHKSVQIASSLADAPSNHVEASSSKSAGSTADAAEASSTRSDQSPAKRRRTAETSSNKSAGAAADGAEASSILSDEPPAKRRKIAEPQSRKPADTTSNKAELKPRKLDPKTVEVSGNPTKRGVFYPCKHDGPCDEARCTCWQNGVHCEKYCMCSPSCNRRFPGCACKAAAKVCSRQDKCICRRFNRECDPDLCGRCGVREILDPMNVDDLDITTDRCFNAQLQLNRPKRTCAGSSLIVPNGYGLYAGEDIHPDELIMEYVGEILCVDETNRRGETYHATKNYLFGLHKDQEVDGGHFGNMLRLANNASSPQFQNSYSTYRTINGTVHVGICAKTEIKAGEEILYDYGYSEYRHVKDFKEKDGSSSWGWIRKRIAEGGPKPSGGRQTRLKVGIDQYTKGAPVAGPSQ